jgi:hypothetical protein
MLVKGSRNTTCFLVSDAISPPTTPHTQFYAAIEARERLPGQPRIDRLFYDLKYAIDLLDEYSSREDEQFEIGNELPGLFRVNVTTGQPLRLDTCQVRSAPVYRPVLLAYHLPLMS